ncbi:hypothetical protein BC940DRAFT_240539 [Gongronella butleri]|nr:hypothetical protein BC940DRAFT_240539 [Gongronella butleri]
MPLPDLSQHRLLVANRGEIAIRVLTAAADLGCETIALSADQDSSHCAHATHAVKLPSAASFLNVSHIIDAAKKTNATMLHPGYGFLSESADLVQQCRAAGILFVGPSAECIDAVGDKVSARKMAQAAGVPVIPGTDASIRDVSEIYAFGDVYGYPLMLKARDGGGGRGIRLVHTRAEANDAFQRCINESPSKQVFMERAVIDAKHIEVQIVGDRHGNVLHLLERDCSIQRRYQKVLEIAPSFLPDVMRSSIQAAALQLARYIKYDSVGTVEFLVSGDQFYFLEVNPRVQVEHTISEQITNVDIVQTQLLMAVGADLHKDLALHQDAIVRSAAARQLVAIQARVVAENPANNHMLSVGQIADVAFPVNGAFGVRVDTWIEPGATVLPTFDSLLAKIIVTGGSLEDALTKTARALQRTVIAGVDTNLDFLTALVLDREYMADGLRHSHTHALERQMPRLLEASKPWALRRQKMQQERHQRLAASSGAGTLPGAGSASAGGSGLMQFKPGDAFNVSVLDDNSNVTAAHTFQVDTINVNRFPDEFTARINSTLPSQPSFSMTLARKAAGAGSKMRAKANPQQPGDVGAPVTGMVVEINVEENAVVKPGQQIYVVSAMKMETVVKSQIHGRVAAIHANPNDLVEMGDLVVAIAEISDSKL